MDKYKKEIIANCLDEHGIKGELQNQIAEDIALGLDEYSIMENSVPDANLKAYNDRKGQEKLEAKEREHEGEVRQLKQEYKDLQDWNRRRINFLESEIERLKGLIKK